MDIMNLVTNLGFPVAIATYLIVSDIKTNRMLLDRIEHLESYQKEVLADIVKNNTIILTKVVDTLSDRPCLRESKS